MVFSLRRRFILFVTLPVALVLLGVGWVSFLYVRSALLEQWSAAAILRLRQTAHEIEMRLDEMREHVHQIAEMDSVPGGEAAQRFLVEKLSRQRGVGFVNIETVASPRSEAERSLGAERGVVTSLDSTGNFLRIAEEFGGTDGKLAKRIVVTVALDSFMKLQGLLGSGPWEGSYACLVTEDGKYLAHSLPAMHGPAVLGESGNPLEKQILRELKRKESGAILGEGHPPEWVAGFYQVGGTDWYLLLFSPGRAILEPILRLRTNYVIASLATVILIIFLIRATARPVALSVAEISQAAEEVEEGNYSVHVCEDRNDEIGQLKRRFNKMVRGLQQRDLIERTFGRYVDRSIAQELLTRPDALRLGGEKHRVTIMICDLRGFTPLAEKLDPEAVIRILNRYLARMISIIEQHKGIIVDFYGDSILVFFDGVHGDVQERAADAVRCAIHMQRELKSFSDDNEREGLPPLHMGIGIHTGDVVVGNIGSETRAKYGIVGSAVNETDRIQAFAEGGAIIISEQTFGILGSRVTTGKPIQASLKGLDGERDLYPVIEIDGQGLRG
ncbi:MAG: HAMP domain-containing protein [Desulfomonile sp.]|nr:HAMP domain-containing protein [Desulfomonile sp.]